MRSVLALILFSVAVALIQASIGIAFAIAYTSHLLIDLFNKSPIPLFFPIKKRICFKLCYADGIGNELFLIMGVFVSLLCVFHALA